MSAPDASLAILQQADELGPEARAQSHDHAALKLGHVVEPRERGAELCAQATADLGLDLLLELLLPLGGENDFLQRSSLCKKPATPAPTRARMVAAAMRMVNTCEYHP